MQTWDPTKFSITVLGNKIVGYGENSFIKASRNEDGWSIHVGADGRVARVRNANQSGRFEITLTRESPSNDVLAAIALQDETDATGYGSTFVKDSTGTAYGHAATSWVVKHADLERDKALGDVTWIIECSKLDIFTGGITDLPGVAV